MIIIEVFVPEAARQRREDARRVARGLIEALGHGATAVQVVLHEPTTWVVGPDGDDAGSGRWIVRVSMPGVWRRAMADDTALATAITKVLAATEPDPQRLLRQPDAWVQFVDVPELAFATLGEPLDITDLADLVTGQLTVAPEGGIDRTELEEGSVRDPVCGMRVDLATTRLHLDVDHVTYGFCSAGCRNHFADQQVLAGHGLADDR